MRKFPFSPIDFQRWERILMRVLLVVVVWRASPPIVGYTAQPKPVGMARWFDLSHLGHPGWMTAANVLLFLGLVGYVAGWFRTLAICVAALVFNAIYTLDNSQGSDHHHTQVIGLVLLVLALHHLWWAGRVYFGKRDTAEEVEGFERRGFFFAQQTLIATYVVSAISKLKASGIGWISDAQLYPLQVRKTERMEHFNVLDQAGPAEGSLAEKIPIWVEETLLQSPTLAMVVIGSGLFLEFGAVLALIGRRFNVLVGFLLVLFHFTVSKAMNLDFEHNIELLLILFVIPSTLFLLGSWLSNQWPRLSERVCAEFGEAISTAKWAWNLVPLKPLIVLVAASFLIIKGPPFSVGYVQAGKEIGDDLKAAEFYPLSPFPMYSRFSERPIYVYLTDETGAEIAVDPMIKVQSSQLKKLYDGELRKVKAATGIPMSKMTAKEKRIAGQETLRIIHEVLAPEAIAKSNYQRLVLYEVVLTQGPDGIERTKTEVGALDL